MKISTKQKIIILAILVLIDLFLGLRTETIEAKSARFNMVEHKLFFFNYCVGSVEETERLGQEPERLVRGLGDIAPIGHYKYYISTIIVLIGIILFIREAQKKNKGEGE